MGSVEILGHHWDAGYTLMRLVSYQGCIYARLGLIEFTLVEADVRHRAVRHQAVASVGPLCSAYCSS